MLKGKLVDDVVMLRNENILNWLSDNEIPFEDEDIPELLLNVATLLEDENQPDWVLERENELLREDEKNLSLLIVDVNAPDKVNEVGWLFTDFAVVEYEDKHTLL